MARFHETLFLRAQGAAARGWLIEVLKAVERIGSPAFTLEDVYACEAQLSALYPGNNNVRPKIRQQLQVLRAKLRFLGAGGVRGGVTGVLRLRRERGRGACGARGGAVVLGRVKARSASLRSSSVLGP